MTKNRCLLLLAALAFAATGGCAMQCDGGFVHDGMAFGGARTSASEAPASAAKAPAVEALTAEQPDAGPTAGKLQESRKIIYKGSLEMVVGDVDDSLRRTEQLATEMGGYLQSLGRDCIEIHVASQNFHKSIEAVERLGTVVNREISAKNVTDEYFDMQIRLKSAKAMQDRLIALLASAATVKEALEVERELNRTRAEIERMEGQLADLDKQVAYSTLSVHFQTASPTVVGTSMQPNLPFLWLHQLGLNRLLAVEAQN
jgi:hypothetical protein